MARDAPVPDYLRPWLPTPEDFAAAEAGTLHRDFHSGKSVWKHFEPFFASRGYSIRFCGESDARRPLVDLVASGDSFHPSATGPFVHSDPDQFDNFFDTKGRDDVWLTRNPKVTYAYDTLNRLVIIKAMDPSESASELDIISYLNSPALRPSPQNHTIPVLEQIETEGWFFLIMPAWNMSCAPPYYVWHVNDYFERVIQSLEGLAFMHEHGVAHRDVSRSNIVFNQDGTCREIYWNVRPVTSGWDVRLAYIDFGISKRFTPGTDSSTWVASESWGTGSHMAPEVVSAEETAIEYQVLPADVYALAQVWKRSIDWEKEGLAIIMRGQPDWRKVNVATNSCKVLEKHVPQYMKLIEEMLDVDPVRRPSAADALSRLQAMRERIPEHVLFAPPGGYPEGLARDE